MVSFTRPNVFEEMPVLGIVPVIDGRLRDSKNLAILQKMAKAVAKLVTANARNPDGTPVKCVIAEPVGGAAERDRCQRLFRRKNVGAILYVSPFWCYAGEVILPDRQIPQAIYGFNGTERPGAVFESAAVSHCVDQGIRALAIYGQDVQPLTQTDTIAADVSKKILAFVRAGMTVAYMRGTNYLSIGSCSMGINGSMPAPNIFRDVLGMGFQLVDMSEIAGRIRDGIYDSRELEHAKKWVAENCTVGFDPNRKGSPHKPSKIWRESILMAMIVQDMMRGNPRLKRRFREKSLGYHALLAGFQGQRHWTDFWPNGDFMEAFLNTSFDWNGLRMPFTVATENDALNGICMMLGSLLTGGSAQIFADLRTFWSPEAVAKVAKGYQLTGLASGGVLHHLNSGPACLDGTGCQLLPDGTPTMKPWWNVTDADIKACLEATTFHPADDVYFPGGGWSTRFCTCGRMPVTMTRIVRDETGHLVLHVVEGETVTLPPEVHNALDKRTNPTWPTTWVAPYATQSMGAYEIMNAWGANHDVLTAGHMGQHFRTVAALLGISVGITNIDPTEQFVPAQWGLYGDRSLGLDDSIARRLGPLYA